MLSWHLGEISRSKCNPSVMSRGKYLTYYAFMGNFLEGNDFSSHKCLGGHCAWGCLQGIFGGRGFTGEWREELFRVCVRVSVQNCKSVLSSCDLGHTG